MVIDPLESGQEALTYLPAQAGTVLPWHSSAVSHRSFSLVKEAHPGKVSCLMPDARRLDNRGMTKNAKDAFDLFLRLFDGARP
jgi:hypothetical protein